MNEPIIELDVHGMTLYQAQIAIDAALRRAGSIYRLRVIHGYGAAGMAAFQQLKATTGEEYAVYFDHIECNLIDSRKYA